MLDTAPNNASNRSLRLLGRAKQAIKQAPGYDCFWPGVASSNGLESAKSCGRVSRKVGAIQPKKIGFQDTLSRCVEQGVIEPSLAGQLKQLMGLRNLLSHFRSVNDQESLFRRALDSQTPTQVTLQRDATFAIGVAVDLLTSPAFRLGR